jgi:hypothetical protein
MVVVIPVLPLPPTSPLRTMAWSPVFVPDVVPETLVPVTVPVEATEVGVMAPRIIVMAGVVESLATVPLTPFAVTTEVVVTVPPLDVKPLGFDAG